ncbi:hypothetical protein LINGRAHAP2_LOCUS8782 [Linum grandiflorum]
MERALKPHDKECMRLAMLKHEETFKEQVYELHRLYRIQKLLMRNQTEKTNKTRPTTTATTTNYSQYQKDHQEIWNSGFSFIPNNTNTTTTNPDEKLAAADHEFGESNGELIDECDIELTLGPTSYAKRMKKRRNNNNNNKNNKKVPETPPLTSESAGPSSFSSSSTGSSQINRTESGTMNKQKKNGSSSISNVDHRLEQQQQAPWFFQVLSLNMT